MDDQENPEAQEEKPEAQEEKPEAQEEKPEAQEEKPEAQEEKPEAQEEKPEAQEEKPEAQEEKPEAQEGAAPPSSRGTVKWFNPDKGYGFLIPEDGSKDVFLHISVLKDGGYTTLEKGATVTYCMGPGRAGPEVVQVLEIDTSTAVSKTFKTERNYDDLEDRLKDSHLIEGTVKWFNPSKGYGFVSPTDGSRDIFIHIAVVRQYGLQTLAPEQKLQIHVAEGPKGPEALVIESASSD